jgi:hypothetical protein
VSVVPTTSRTSVVAAAAVSVIIFSPLVGWPYSFSVAHGDA